MVWGHERRRAESSLGLLVYARRVTADLAFTDATEQADLVRRGEAKPSELVDAAIDRIERVNPKLNAVIHARFEQAREEAIRPTQGPFS
ncbi:MAG: amidase, partial [Acidimicrobiaceae bacterium]|nr:amidase [Acidimicrobiaceae bacterium]